MIFKKTPITDMYSIEVEPFNDHRGAFARGYCQREFEAAGIREPLRQANISKNPTAYTLRGFHYQLPPFGENKLLRCENGSIFDVVIDMRPDSPSYLEWYGETLTAGKSNMLWVPKGCAHAFLTLEDHTSVFYMVSEFYTPDKERGLRHDDPYFQIEWPAPVEVVSDKDNSWPDFDPDSHAQTWTH